MTVPTKDEFLVWCDSPVTRWIFEACKKQSAAQEHEWHDVSWVRGLSEPLLLCELRTRGDAYRALHETQYEAWCAVNGDAPRIDERDKT